MFAEDLLRDLRRDGFTPSATATYVRRIFSRVALRLPRHPELVRSVAATALGLFSLQFAAALLLSATMDRRLGVAYLVASSGVLLVASFWILFHLGLIQGAREADGAPPLRHIPVPVALTLLRLVSIPALVLLIDGRRWSVVVWVFGASALTDILDGILARALRCETQVGVVLDPLTDVAFNTAVFVALAASRALPWWVTSLMLGRYGLLILGTFFLYIFHGPVRIQPTVFGKLTGVLTTLLVGFLLLGLAHWSDATRLRLQEVFDVGLGLMALATIIQVVFIGLGNLKAPRPVLLEEVRPAKVVGEIGPPRG